MNGHCPICFEHTEGRSGIQRPLIERGTLKLNMDALLSEFNPDAEFGPVLRPGQVYLWFVTTCPIADGDGRVALAIAEITLTQA